jgi:biotin carboxylase
MSAKEPALFDDEILAPTVVEQAEDHLIQPTADEVEAAICIMEKHLGREARNRQVDRLAPDDLCPAQKTDMVRDLAKLFRG